MTPSFGFSKRARLTHRREFLGLQQRGAKIHTKHFLIFAAPSDHGAEEERESRLGITITLKVDKRAVMRNRLRRRIREFFRLHRHHLKSPTDLVVIARQGAPALSYAQIRDELLRGCHKGGLLSAAPVSGDLP
jgi:ribonuclease P protein component